MSQVAELIQECKARLAEIEKDAEHLEQADETQLRLAAKRLELFAEHLAGLRASVPVPEPSAEPAPEDDGLEQLKRAELNDRALELGVDAPDKLPNKDAVIAAIRKAQAEPAPEDDGLAGDE